jgi:lipopolysaccharide export system protein LptC
MNEPVALPPEAPFSELTPLAARAGARPVPAGNWPARLWDGVVSYAPVVLMAVLAGLSWWLVKNTPVSGDADVKRALRHVPDYTMDVFSIVSYGPQGTVRSRLEGDVLRHYPDTDTVEVDKLRLRVVDLEGRVTLGSAERAVSNGDATQVRMTGKARIVREPGPKEGAGERLEIRGEFLELLTESERVKSHLPVTLITPRGELRAGNLDYSHLDRNAQLGGRVRGELRPVPRPAP